MEQWKEIALFKQWCSEGRDPDMFPWVCLPTEAEIEMAKNAE